MVPEPRWLAVDVGAPIVYTAQSLTCNDDVFPLRPSSSFFVVCLPTNWRVKPLLSSMSFGKTWRHGEGWPFFIVHAFVAVEAESSQLLHITISEGNKANAEASFQPAVFAIQPDPCSVCLTCSSSIPDCIRKLCWTIKRMNEGWRRSLIHMGETSSAWKNISWHPYCSCSHPRKARFNRTCLLLLLETQNAWCTNTTAPTLTLAFQPSAIKFQ